MTIINLLLSAGSTFTQWRRREKAYGELMSLDDRSLSDIGVHRSQIPALVEGFYRGGDVAEPAAPHSQASSRAKLAGGR